ncbi:MAG: BCCT family transporter [Alphaproteobacteria bacterium]|nr:MAG: BCCT family transporter [Alphaproteobacteria bacterium]
MSEERKDDEFDLPEHHAPEDLAYDTDFTTGQDNIQFWGLDLHNPVFFVGAFLIAAFVVSSLSFPDVAREVFLAAKNGTIQNFDWLFVITTNIVFLFCVGIGVSKFGKIRIGGPDAKPEFSTISWIAMLFSAGVGIGMVFYGAAEPMAYYTGWSGTPLNAPPLTPEAERLAFSATIFHWGITPWAIYAVIGLALAYFTFNRGLPLTIRSTFYPLFGERVWGWPGHVVDLLAVVATLFGLATSLGLGAKQAASGLHFLFGTDPGLNTQVILIVGITSLAIFSVVRGLDGGVKLLSNINIALAIVVLLFVILAGPTMLILKSFGTNFLGYLEDVTRLSNWIGRDDKDWFHGWTIFYWAWWISWSPFVGMFIARVSKGRTIRQFLLAVIALPTVVSVIWFSSFGVTAIDQVQNGVGTLPNGINDVSLVLFQMLEQMPIAQISTVVAIVLLIIFFVTSSDSGSLVIDSITAGGKLHAPVPQRIFWATMEGLVAIVLLVGGGATALSSLQAGAIAVGLPFSLVLIVCCVSLLRGLMTEPELESSEEG